MARQSVLDQDIEKTFYTAEVLQEKIQELGAKISTDYEGKNPLIVGILTGAVVFLTDLVRYVTIPMELDFMSASSYGHSTTSSGSVKILKDLNNNPEGRHIIIVEDIVDTGLTINTLQNLLMSRGALSVKVCTLLDKAARRTHPVANLDYIGFECPDEFLVGFGLDYAEKYRNLPYIGVLKRSIYEG